MHLKRQYAKDEQGNVIDPPKVTHVEIVHTGKDAEQHFSVKLIAQGVADGWLILEGNRLTMKATPEDLHYTIVRVPGYYSGEIIHYYDCLLNAAQHEKYKNRRA